MSKENIMESSAKTFSRLITEMNKWITKFGVDETTTIDDLISEFPVQFPTREDYYDWVLGAKNVHGHRTGKGWKATMKEAEAFIRMCKALTRSQWTMHTESVTTTNSDGTLHTEVERVCDFNGDKFLPVIATHQSYHANMKKMVTLFIALRVAGKQWRYQIRTRSNTMDADKKVVNG
jgi:hypothetical protein